MGERYGAEHQVRLDEKAAAHPAELTGGDGCARVLELGRTRPDGFLEAWIDPAGA